LGIKEDDLDRWTERCRKVQIVNKEVNNVILQWLSQTVLARVVKEVNSINEKLIRIGCSELQIGSKFQGRIQRLEKEGAVCSKKLG